jgi:hypothetical protein
MGSAPVQAVKEVCCQYAKEEDVVLLELDLVGSRWEGGPAAASLPYMLLATINHPGPSGT